MTAKEAIALTNIIIQPHSLSNVQNLVFHQCWEGKSYGEIAAISAYNSDYLREIGAQMWRMLSDRFGKKVTKNNLRSVLTQYEFSAQTAQDSNIEPRNLYCIAHPITNSRQIDRFTTNQFTDWGDAIDDSFFDGRSSELATLQQWILGSSSQENPSYRCRLISLLGMEGIGKTFLAVKIAQQVQDQFDFVIWRSLRNAPSIENILAQWIQFLSHQEKIVIPSNLDDQIICLLHYLRISRCLLVLDNFESILQSGDLLGRYLDGYEGYGQLLRCIGATSHQSCLIVTSRKKPIGLAAKEVKNLLVRSLQLAGLPDLDVRQILKQRAISVALTGVIST